MLVVVLLTGLAHAGQISVDAGRGPVTIYVPASYTPGTPAPLLVLLHGYTATGAQVEAFVQMQPVTEQYGFLYCHPNGTKDNFNNWAWNGAGCCGAGIAGIDDVAYLRDLIFAIAGQLDVDDKRIFLMGHSNGGFMSHRMACESTDLIAGIASLAGVNWKNPATCTPSETIHVLQMHGTSDGVIPFNGNGNWPGAQQTVDDWRARNGCDATAEVLPAFDADASVSGSETTVERWADCDVGGSVELWTMVGSGHIPNVTAAWRTQVMDWFVDHPKPGDWVDLGGALAGASGEPSLSGVGALLGNDPMALTLSGALGSAPVAYVLGFTQLGAPFKGGTMVPFPDVILYGLVTDAVGGNSLQATWPPGLPSGFELYLQAWITDAAAAVGFAASNGLVATTP
jgi:polyhydroxybutyrate depolymerase